MLALTPLSVCLILLLVAICSIPQKFAILYGKATVRLRSCGPSLITMLREMLFILLSCLIVFTQILSLVRKVN